MQTEIKKQISLEGKEENQEKDQKGDKFHNCIDGFWEFLQEQRGERAKLRRCSTPTEVYWESALYQLQKSLERAGQFKRKEKLEQDLERVAVIAAVLSHVSSIEKTSYSFAKAMAQEHQGKPRVSDLRFRKLLLIDEMPELMLALIRMVHLLGSPLPIGTLARSIWDWGEVEKKKWAWDYYQIVLPHKQEKERK